MKNLVNSWKLCTLLDVQTIMSQASHEEGATTIPKGSTRKCVEVRGLSLRV